MPLVVATCAKLDSKFAVIIPNQIAWFFSIRSRFSQLLRHPGIGGGSGHIHVDDLPRFQVDDEESKKRAEEKVWDLEKIAGPDLCGMIVQESSPVLSTWSFEANQLLMLLNGPFTHSNIELEQLTTDALRSPKPVICRYLFDQADRLGRDPWLI